MAEEAKPITSKELKEFLNEQTNTVLDAVDKKIDEKNKDLVIRLMDVFSSKDEIKEMISPLSTKEDFNGLMDAIDAYAKKSETYHQETTMLTNKANRQEKWITKIANKIDLKLES